MRAIFSILGLLIVVAVIGFLAKKQLGATSQITVRPADGASSTLPAAAPGMTVPQQSQQMQQQVKQSVEAAMQQTRPMPDDK